MNKSILYIVAYIVFIVALALGMPWFSGLVGLSQRAADSYFNQSKVQEK